MGVHYAIVAQQGLQGKEQGQEGAASLPQALIQTPFSQIGFWATKNCSLSPQLPFPSLTFSGIFCRLLTSPSPGPFLFNNGEASSSRSNRPCDCTQ